MSSQSRKSRQRSTRGPQPAHAPTGVDESTAGDNESIPLDTLLQAFKSLGHLDQDVVRKSRSSTSIEDLRSWTDLDIRRDFAQGLAGLCVLRTRASGKKKTNIVATTLFQDNDSKQWTLLCSGNQPLDTKGDIYGNFFRDAIRFLKNIAHSAIDLKGLGDIALADVRAQHEDLAKAEREFVLWAYRCHFTKLKSRIVKRGPPLEVALQGHIDENPEDKEKDPSLVPLIGALKTLNDCTKLDLANLTDDNILRIHKSGRSIYHAICRSQDRYKALGTAIHLVKKRSVVEILEKVATAASFVNNLVVLAAGTALGEALLDQKLFPGPTFVKPSLPTGKFAPSTIDSTRLYNRFLTLYKDTEKLADLQPKRAWQSALHRAGPSDSCEHTNVHCECIIAVELLRRGLKGTYYIGCPKLSCVPCFLFIEAVNKVGKHKDVDLEIVMEGTHGLWFLPWSIPPDTPPSIQPEFEKVSLDWMNKTIAHRDPGGNDSQSDGAVNIAPFDPPSP